jgi:hypothetical protein
MTVILFPRALLSLSFDKKSVDLGGIAAFKSLELLGRHGVEGVLARAGVEPSRGIKSPLDTLD